MLAPFLVLIAVSFCVGVFVQHYLHLLPEQDAIVVAAGSAPRCSKASTPSSRRAARSAGRNAKTTCTSPVTDVTQVKTTTNGIVTSPSAATKTADRSSDKEKRGTGASNRSRLASPTTKTATAKGARSPECLGKRDKKAVVVVSSPQSTTTTAISSTQSEASATAIGTATTAASPTAKSKSPVTDATLPSSSRETGHLSSQTNVSMSDVSPLNSETSMPATAVDIPPFAGKLVCDCGLEDMDANSDEVVLPDDLERPLSFPNKTLIYPISYDRYQATSLAHPPEGPTSVSQFALKLPDRSTQLNVMTPFRPLLHAMYYAHRHAVLVKDLVENYQYLEN